MFWVCVFVSLWFSATTKPVQTCGHPYWVCLWVKFQFAKSFHFLFLCTVGIHPPWMKKAEKKAHGHVCNQYLHYNCSAVKSFQIKKFQMITCFITHKGYFDFKAKQTGIGWIELNYDFRLKRQLKWKKNKFNGTAVKMDQTISIMS